MLSRNDSVGGNVSCVLLASNSCADYNFHEFLFSNRICLYSIVDLLYYDLANLFTKISAGFARLTPKFLGTLCLTNDEN